MSKAKYVIINDKGIEMPIVFNPLIEHTNFQHLDIVAAGWCRKVENVYDCFGKSVGLGIKSRLQEDSNILNGFLFYDM